MLALLFACSSYETTSTGAASLISDEDVEVVFDDRWIVFEPTAPLSATAVVFYPGGLVKHEAYAAPLRQIAAGGVTTVLVSMPSDLAVLASKRADDVIEAVDADRWVVAGHSLGGSMAGRYAADHEVAGLALWAAYLAGNDDLSDSDLPVLSVLASEDEVLDQETYDERRSQLPSDAVEVVLEGGNHAGFGDYGDQRGDGEATLPVGEQHRLTAEAMLGFVFEQVD